jgi:hypothetical protein
MIRISTSKPVSIFIILFLLTGCVSLTDKTAYPPSGEIGKAYAQRHEFVNLYLQGRFCEAKNQFEKSVRSFLMQDDFCSAAGNYMVFYNLKMYSDIKDAHLFDTAVKLKNLGGGCPDLEALLLCSGGDCSNGMNPKDAFYRKLLEERNFNKLLEAASGEEDRLYASVYLRKTARNALIHNRKLAEKFLKEAIGIDAAQGWVVFLCEDWSIMAGLASAPEEKERILERVKMLSTVLQPCD